MLILGGFKDQQRFELLQSCILKLITGNNDTGCDDDDDDIERQRYQQFFTSIKWLNTGFNLDAKAPDLTGECSFDVVVDRCRGWNERVLSLFNNDRFSLLDYVLCF